MTRRILLASTAVAALAPLLLGLAGPAFGQTLIQTPQRPRTQPLDPKGEFLMRADEVVYDRENEIVTARGRVEISQGARVLLADAVSYNRKTEIVTATGEVKLIEPSGDVVFSNHVQVTTDLAKATAANFRSLLFDNSRMAATSATREEGVRKELKNAVFSPCNLCDKDPSRPPIWQIKAVNITHDEQKKEVVYKDATMEMWGVPVFYTPYFSHPDPSVKRRSGFLAPSVGQSKRLGFKAGIPYYGIIDDTSDFTLEPRVYSEEGGLLAGEYRKRFAQGKLRVAGSALSGRRVEDGKITDDRTVRGHIAAEGRFDLNDHWRMGFDLSRATDRTYLRRFGMNRDFGSRGRADAPNQLTSTAYVERFEGRDYFSASAFSFQTLRADEQRERIARIHPFAEYSTYSGQDHLGGTWRVDANMLSMSRKLGADYTRASSTAGYYMNRFGRFGDVWAMSATAQTDAYWTNDVLNQVGEPTDGFVGRVHPQLHVHGRLPLIRRFNGYAVVLEPQIGGVLAPNGGNPDRIPRFDSVGFEFDDTNLFSRKRYSGYDRIASGSRIDYGVSSTVLMDGGASAGLMVGQSWRPHKDSTYAPGSGLEGRASDIVGRVFVRPKEWVDLSYRYRLSTEGLKPNRQELATTFFRWGGAVSLSYINYRPEEISGGVGPRPETIAGAISVPVGDNWSLFGSHRRDLKANRPVSSHLGVIYRDECFAAALTYERENYADGDIQAGSTILFRLGYKYLGDFGG